jgi:hypothetical protein
MTETDEPPRTQRTQRGPWPQPRSHKKRKESQKAYRVEVFVSLCVFCGDKDLRTLQIF